MHSEYESPRLVGSGLYQRFGDRTILDQVDIEVEAGRPAFLIGPNGSGKTTLLDILGGEVRPLEGSVSLNGEPVAAVDRSRIRFVQQTGALFDDLTVRETMGLWSSLFGVIGSDDLLSQFGLRKVADDRVRGLSGGECQRLRLALMCIGDAAVYLIDEPTNNLDSDAHEIVVEILNELATRAKLLVVATHDLDLLLAVEGSLHLVKDAQLVSGLPTDPLWKELEDVVNIQDIYEKEVLFK